LSSVTSLYLTEAVIWIALFLLVCGPVHEFAHALTALRLGDGTARLFGRVTLDPFAHFDPVGGTLLVVSVLLGVFTGNPIGFGWAKPTPVNPSRLRGRYGDSLVAVAGPLSNLALAVVFAIGFRLMYANGFWPDNRSVGNLVALVFWIGMELNVVLMLFNLLPVPPLDGSHVLFDLLNPRTAYEVRNFMNQYGLMLLIIVVMFAGQIIGPIVAPIMSFLAGVPVG
jgi:Zn-dependent protease